MKGDGDNNNKETVGEQTHKSWTNKVTVIALTKYVNWSAEWLLLWAGDLKKT